MLFIQMHTSVLRDHRRLIIQLFWPCTPYRCIYTVSGKRAINQYSFNK